MNSIIKYFIDNKIRTIQESPYTWPELGAIYDMSGDAARGLYRRGKDIINQSILEEPLQEEITVESYDSEIPSPPVAGAKMKSIWQSASGKWMTSYSVKEGAFDYNELSKTIQNDLKGFVPINFLKIERNEDESLYMISLPDLHYGKESIESTDNKVKTVINDFLSRIQTKNNRFLFIIGNDIVNCDTPDYTTTKGTRLEQQVNWKDSFKAAWRSMIAVTHNLLKLGKVDIINILGNHDYTQSFAMGEIIDAYFTNNPDVTVDNHNDDRKYFQYGKTLMMFDHGELKPTEYPLTMAVEQPAAWGETKHRFIFCGHLHHEMSKEYKGVKVKFLPSLCDNDSWHKKNGYVGATKAAQMFQFHKENGFVAMYESNVE